MPDGNLLPDEIMRMMQFHVMSHAIQQHIHSYRCPHWDVRAVGVVVEGGIPRLPWSEADGYREFLAPPGWTVTHILAIDDLKDCATPRLVADAVMEDVAFDGALPRCVRERTATFFLTLNGHSSRTHNFSGHTGDFDTCELCKKHVQPHAEGNTIIKQLTLREIKSIGEIDGEAKLLELADDPVATTGWGRRECHRVKSMNHPFPHFDLEFGADNPVNFTETRYQIYILSRLPTK